MPITKQPSPEKEVIPTCQCGCQVYGYQGLVNIRGRKVPGWAMLTCYKCGARTSERIKAKEGQSNV